MGDIAESLPKPTPSILRVQALPILPKGRKFGYVVAELTTKKEIQVNRAPPKVVALQGLASARPNVDGLLLRRAVKLAASDDKAQFIGLV
jgi:hypothetical protein